MQYRSKECKNWKNYNDKIEMNLVCDLNFERNNFKREREREQHFLSAIGCVILRSNTPIARNWTAREALCVGILPA